MTKSLSGCRTTQMRCDCLNRSSTPMGKSEGAPMRNLELGSNSVRGKKKRRNIRKLIPRNPPMLVQTKRRCSFRGAAACSLPSALSVAPGFTAGFATAGFAFGAGVGLDPASPVPAGGNVLSISSFELLPSSGQACPPVCVPNLIFFMYRCQDFRHFRKLFCWARV